MATVFEWDEAKARVNAAKHGVSFELAQDAFLDPKHLLAEDMEQADRRNATSVSAWLKAT